MTDLLWLLVACVALSIGVIRASIYGASVANLADHPGNDHHKQHDISTPFVGGTGVLAAFCLGFFVLAHSQSGLFQKDLVLGICTMTIFSCGLLDDIKNLSYKPRLAIQALVGFLMVLAGGVVLNEFGELLPDIHLHLGLLAIPVTVFAVIGGINTLNMMDGIDGLAGSLSLVSLLLIGGVTFIGNDAHNLMLVTALVGGVTGFLYFNLRYGRRYRARVFLGDNGSMLLGFIIAWLLVDISQGRQASMTPVTALWLFSIPLMDTLSVMLRRLLQGSSPFTADRNHLHHLLQRAGLSVTRAVFFITGLHVLLGVTGLVGLYRGVPEFVMFFAFLLTFLGYFYLTVRPERFVSLLRHGYIHLMVNTRWGLTPVASTGTFQRGYSAEVTQKLARIVSERLAEGMNYDIKIFEQPPADKNSEKRYAIRLNVWTGFKENVSAETLKVYEVLLQEPLSEQGIQLRQLARRRTDIDPDASVNGQATDEPTALNQHVLAPQRLLFEVLFNEDK